MNTGVKKHSTVLINIERFTESMYLRCTKVIIYTAYMSMSFSQQRLAAL